MADVASGSSITDWITAISQLAFLIIFILLFTGANQRFQMYLWGKEIRAGLAVLQRYVKDAEEKSKDLLAKYGSKRPKTLVERLKDYVFISPVDIEPTDIIRRLDHLLETRRAQIKQLLMEELTSVGKVERYKAETSLEILSALNMIYKIVRHILLLGEKTNNFLLVMQLRLLLPQIMKIAEGYRKALDDFIKGAPIGDSIGPQIALHMAGTETPWIHLDDDTVAAKAEYDGRTLILVKAEGPASNVGRPGVAVEKIVEEDIFGTGKPSLIITVDAALKLEGEDTGSIAEGVGAAIGDPGPEKIRIERTASKHKIPLRAVVIKMGMEEAILTMKKEIYEGGVKAIERLKEIINEETNPGETILIAGIGNSIGIGQKLEKTEVTQ
ncbi:MAG: DUF1512 domain-containing protein [Desulfurococcales archaeon]|nr:DUF1512 domain-containing protein [Desulfurococcales archaeon]